MEMAYGQWWKWSETKVDVWPLETGSTGTAFLYQLTWTWTWTWTPTKKRRNPTFFFNAGHRPRSRRSLHRPRFSRSPDPRLSPCGPRPQFHRSRRPGTQSQSRHDGGGEKAVRRLVRRLFPRKGSHGGDRFVSGRWSRQSNRSNYATVWLWYRMTLRL